MRGEAGKVTLGKGVIRIRKVFIKGKSCQALFSSPGTELIRMSLHTLTSHISPPPLPESHKDYYNYENVS